jgi:hypothetical protein
MAATAANFIPSLQGFYAGSKQTAKTVIMGRKTYSARAAAIAGSRERDAGNAAQ